MCSNSDPKVLQRFLRYTEINTTSDPKVVGQRLPTTDGQLRLGEVISEELRSIGAADVHVDTQGIVYATFSAAAGYEQARTIGFTPHLDTAPDYTTDTHARVQRSYAGGDIALEHGGVVIPEEQLRAYVGDDIVVTDGTSLLGSDDKAAIAAVVTGVEEALQAGRHGPIQLAFLPDEEIGLLGAKALDLTRFKPDFGYCLDACAIGEYAVKTWFASHAVVTVKGTPAHPMNAKGRMVNPINVLCDGVLEKLPKGERLEHTEGEEGAIFVKSVSGCGTHAEAHLFLRYFTKGEMAERKALLNRLVAGINAAQKSDIASVSITDTYSNPQALLEEHPHVMSMLLACMEKQGVAPKPFVMRGGYDGCALADRGLPFANFFTGGHNFHCNKEFLPVKSLVAAKDMVKSLIALSPDA